jgi:hypothetical protein
VIYATAILPQIQTSYFASRNLGVTRLDTAIDYAKNVWVWGLLATLVVRATLLRKLPFHPLVDSLPAAAILYTAAIIFLKFQSNYYTAPCVWIAYAYIAFVLTRLPIKMAVVLATVCVIFQIPPALAQFEEFKENVAARSQALRYIQKNSPASIIFHARNVDAYAAGLFAGYLRARSGRPVEVSVDDNKDWTNKTMCVSGWQDITAKNDEQYKDHKLEDTICDANQPTLAGQFVVSFNRLLDHPSWPLVFTSKPIGWWKNHYFVYVYQAN